MTRRILFVVGLFVIVVLGAYLAGARRTTGPPLDPGSTAPDGTKAVVELVSRLGGSIHVVDGLPTADADVALLLQDHLGPAATAGLRTWVRAGGTLVVADPDSSFSPAPVGAVVDEVTGTCPIDGLGDVGRLQVGVARSYAIGAGATGCFGTRPGQAVVVATADGAGRVISIGGPDLFTNDLLDEADNAVLVASLLAGDGTQSVFLRPALPGGGNETLADLIGTPVRAALAQLVVAFLVVVGWRSRRLGRPVEEFQPVRIEGSELTRAVGRLLARNHRPERAAAILRDHARHDLSGVLGIPLDATGEVVAAALRAHTDLSDTEIHRAVASPVTTDDDLVVVAALLARIREETTHDRSQPAARR